MVSFGSLSKIVSLSVGFHLGRLQSYFFFSKRLLAEFEFLIRTSNKTRLNGEKLTPIHHIRSEFLKRNLCEVHC